MVKLKDDEKRMLNGDEGYVKQRCMEWLVEAAEAGGAEELIDLDGTGDFHTPMTAMAPFYQFPIEELRKIVDEGAQFKIPTFSNKSPFPELAPIHGWQNCDVRMAYSDTKRHDNPADHNAAMHEEYYELFRKMGLINTHSCTIYLTSSYLPTLGQHCSWNESSAVPYCNAVLGARSNIDGSFATCFLGKAPYYDMHITENRYGEVLVKTDHTISDDIEWDMLGFTVGEDVGVHVPVLTGTSKPNATQLEKLNSALNTGGSVRMYHIPGTTPEAPTVEAAMGGRKPKREVMIDRARLAKTYDKLNYRTSDDVDLVYLGCPHLNIVELMKIARRLEGKTCKVPLWIMTAPWLYDVAKNLGYIDIYEKAGAHLMDGTCLAAIGGVPDDCHHLALDSAKQSYYITGCYPNGGLEVCYGTQDDCIDAALTGTWHGEWR